MKLLIDTPENTVGRDFVVGDIHGMYSLLMSKLKEVNFDKTKDRLFSVGDLVDRGPHNLEVLRLIKEPWFFAVRGNHEDMMIGHFAGGEFSVVRSSGWIQNYGGWVREEDIPEIRKLCLYLIDEVPIARRVKVAGKWVHITHAGPLPHMHEDIISEFAGALIWDRNLVMRSLLAKEKGISGEFKNYCVSFHGHTPLKGVLSVDNRVNWIDTGAFYTNVLTLVEMKDFIHEARDQRAVDVHDGTSERSDQDAASGSEVGGDADRGELTSERPE